MVGQLRNFERDLTYVPWLGIQPTLCDLYTNNAIESGIRFLFPFVLEKNKQGNYNIPSMNELAYVAQTGIFPLVVLGDNFKFFNGDKEISSIDKQFAEGRYSVLGNPINDLIASIKEKYRDSNNKINNNGCPKIIAIPTCTCPGTSSYNIFGADEVLNMNKDTPKDIINTIKKYTN